MPAERIGMRDAREVIRLKSASVSTHEIARRLGLARSTVRETLKRAETAGIAWPLPDDMTDAALAATMRQTHAAGERLFVDYAGDGVPVVVDRLTGEIRMAQIFVAVLGASSFTFATRTQALPD